MASRPAAFSLSGLVSSLTSSHSPSSNAPGAYTMLPSASDQGEGNISNEKRAYQDISANGTGRIVSSGSSILASSTSSSTSGVGVGSAPALTAPKEERPPSRGMVIFSVLFYLVAALVMVMANKWVLNSVPVPLFFLFVQLAMAVVLLHISAIFGYFTIPNVRLNVCKGLLPLVSINVTGLIFNTYCLQYVDASFYQVARGLVLPFTVLFSFFLLKSHVSAGSLIGVLIVCVGFFLGVSAEHLHTSPIGTMLGVFSSLTTSVHAIAVKRALNVVKGSTMELVYYNNLLSAALLAPLVILSGEYTAVNAMYTAGGDSFRTFVVGASVTGIFGFLICIAGFLSIKVTSPVSHMVSSAVRGVIQTFLGMWCFGDIITAGRGAGILFILAGSTWYTYVKDREARNKEAILAAKPAIALTSPTLSTGSGGFSSRNISPVSTKSVNRMGLSINSSLANPAARSDQALSPRTPNQTFFSAPSSEVREVSATTGIHSAGLRNVSSPPALLANSVNGRQAVPSTRRSSYSVANPDLAESASSETSGRSSHGKTFSVTDLRDILVTPNDRQKDDKLY